MWTSANVLSVCFLVICTALASASPPQIEKAAGFSRETRVIWKWIRHHRFVNNYPSEFKQFLWTSDAMREAENALEDYETATGHAAQEARVLFHSILGASRTNNEEVFELADSASRYVARRLVNRYHEWLQH